MSLRPSVVYGAYRAGSSLLGLVPDAIARRLGGVIGPIAARRSPQGRAVVAENLAHVLGEPPTSPAVIQIVAKAYASYAQYWIDSARLSPRRAKRASVSVDGMENLDGAIRSGRGTIIVLPHLGNWDVGGAWLADHCKGFTTVAEVLEPPALFEWFKRRREAIGMQIVPLAGDAGPKLLKVLEEGGVVALLSDRDLAGDGIEIQLFGARTRMPIGAAVLALRSGAVLFSCGAYQEPKASVRLVALPPIDTSRQGGFRADVARVTAAIRDDFETLIAQAPEQWHLFQPNWPAVEE